MNDRIRVYSECSLRETHKTLFVTISHIYNKLPTIEQLPQEPAGDNGPNLDSPNEGWKWAESNGITLSKKNLLARVNLRKLGYVFLDAKRIHRDWRFQATSPDMIDLRQRSSCDIGFLGPYSLLKIHGEKIFDEIPLPHAMFEEDHDRLLHLLDPSGSMSALDPYPEPFSEAEMQAFGFEY